MTKELLKKIITNLKTASDNIHEYGKFGIDLYDNDKSPVAPLDIVVDTFLVAFYEEDGVDYFYEYCYEGDFEEHQILTGIHGHEDIEINSIDDLFYLLETFRK